jgi:hypothetical protein
MSVKRNCTIVHGLRIVLMNKSAIDVHARLAIMIMIQRSRAGIARLVSVLSEFGAFIILMDQ